MSRSPGCILFDNDGTLVDSELVQQTAMSDELAVLGINKSAESLSLSYRGWNLSDQLTDLSERSAIQIEADFIPRFRARLSKCLQQQLKPSIGMFDALQQLPYTKCVASNAPAEKVELCLAVTGLDQFFDGNIFSAYEVGKWKPEPELFLHAAQTMGFASDDCVVVEDSAVGVQAGEAAGMTTIFYNPHALKVDHSEQVHEITAMSELASTIAQL